MGAKKLFQARENPLHIVESAIFRGISLLRSSGEIRESVQITGEQRLRCPTIPVIPVRDDSPRSFERIEKDTALSENKPSQNKSLFGCTLTNLVRPSIVSPTKYLCILRNK
jgi:hypothetical protein